MSLELWIYLDNRTLSQAYDHIECERIRLIHRANAIVAKTMASNDLTMVTPPPCDHLISLLTNKYIEGISTNLSEYLLTCESLCSAMETDLQLREKVMEQLKQALAGTLATSGVCPEAIWLVDDMGRPVVKRPGLADWLQDGMEVVMIDVWKDQGKVLKQEGELSSSLVPQTQNSSAGTGVMMTHLDREGVGSRDRVVIGVSDQGELKRFDATTLSLAWRSCGIHADLLNKAREKIVCVDGLVSSVRPIQIESTLNALLDSDQGQGEGRGNTRSNNGRNRRDDGDDDDGKGGIASTMMSTLSLNTARNPASATTGMSRHHSNSTIPTSPTSPSPRSPSSAMFSSSRSPATLSSTLPEVAADRVWFADDAALDQLIMATRNAQHKRQAGT